MLKEYFLMKKKEIKLKSLLYSKSLDIVNEQKDFMDLLYNIYNELKKVPPEELKEELLMKTARLLSKHTG